MKQAIYNSLILLFISTLTVFSQGIKPDSSFGANGRFTYTTTFSTSVNYAYGPFQTIKDNSNNIYLAIMPSSSTTALLIKLDAEGKTVAGFGNNGIFNTGNFRSTTVQLVDTTLYLAGHSSNYTAFIQKVSATKGTNSSSFSFNPALFTVYNSAIDVRSNVIYLVGQEIKSGIGSNFAIIKKSLNDDFQNNTTSTSFRSYSNNSNTSRVFHKVLVVEDSIIIAVGHDFTNSIVARFDKNLNLVTSFGVNGFVTLRPANVDNYAYSAAVKNNYIYVSGGAKRTSSNTDLFVAKLDLTGKTVSGFGTNGIAIHGSTNNESNGWDNISFQPNDKILLCGSIVKSGTRYGLVVRLNSDGTADNTFHNNSAFYESPVVSNYNSILALSDSSFVVSNVNPTSNVYVQDVMKFTQTKPVLTSISEAPMSNTTLKLYYSEGRIYTVGQEIVDEMVVNTLNGTIKSYANVSSVPVEANQVYVIRYRVGNQTYINKIATH